MNYLFPDKNLPSDYIQLDLSARNTELSAEIYSNLAAFSHYISTKIGDKMGVGGYLEHRVIYEAHTNFATAASDFRNIHLGIDVWSTAGTAIFAPFDGIVKHLQINAGSGNYGPTIILYHPHLDLHSLYGHLAEQDLKNLRIGQAVRAGDKIAHMGDAHENGGWPPHLHVQLIKDLQGNIGDYPGVCSQRDLLAYAANCPNPSSFLESDKQLQH